MDDKFGFLDADEPKTYTAPPGLSSVHQSGMSWAQQGTSYQTTSRVSPNQYNHLIAQFRGLLNVPGVDVSAAGADSPLLLRTFISQAIIAILGGTIVNQNGLAPLASPAFTGTPTAPTQTAGNNSTRIATTAFVKTAVDNLIAAAPGSLDTLNELASALGNDPAFSATVLTALSNRIRADAAQTFTAAQQEQARDNISSALRGQLWGLTLSNNVSDAVNDIDCAAGEAASTETNPVLMKYAGGTKRLDAAWAVGSGNGGRDTGSIADGTWHDWLIRRPDTGVVDRTFSLSATSPTMPASYTQKRRIGSFLRVSGAILPFYQSGDVFRLSTFINERNSVAAIASALFTLAGVPAGIEVAPILRTYLTMGGATGASASLLFGSAAKGSADISVNTIASTTADGNEATTVMPPPIFFTNTSRQLYFAMTSSLAATSAGFDTLGWVDRRGQDGGL